MPDDNTSQPEEDLPNDHSITEHQLTVDEVCRKYGTRLTQESPYTSPGLTTEDVKRKLLEFGQNCLTPPKKKHPFMHYLEKLAGLFNVMLIIAGILCFVLYAIDSSEPANIYLGAILIFVAFMNALIEFYQEYKTSAILESFKSLVAQKALAIRDSRLLEVDAIDLVLGDLVSIKMGDKVPADLRLVACNEMKVDNSSITGESEPQERNLSTAIDNVLESSCLVFSGSTIVSGEGLGIVIRIGDSSMIGQIAALTVGSEQRTSQLTEEINVFVRRTGLIAIIVAIIFFIFGLASDYGVGITFSFAIGTFVAFIPQGLPVTVSLLLTVAAKRLSRKNVLVKDLNAVETLGSITVLATDKTGTLTQNKMTVVSVWMNNNSYASNMEKMEGALIVPNDAPNVQDLITICCLCAKSKFDPSEADLDPAERKIFGDATEVGLLKFALQYENAPALMERFPKVLEIPFNSTNKWHLTISALPHSEGEYTLMIKGAPERIKKMCKYIKMGEEDVEWDESHDALFNQAYEAFASRGRRVLAFAIRKLDRKNYPEGFAFTKEPYNFEMDQFSFVGLIGLMDPPKHGVRKAIAACRTAGIQVIMITGDHPLTAEAIARHIGLIQGQTAHDMAIRERIPVEAVPEEAFDAVVVHGDEIDDMTTENWDLVLSKLEIIFARTSPKHKLDIITRLQAKGHIVGCSGDGVNDSPALKKADLGISMNFSASDVSKEAASLILLDDNFPTIVVGIKEGRLIFANLKKSIRYTLTHIMPEVLAFLVFIIFGIPLPISSILVLFLDLGAELGPAISYAWESAEGDLMRVPPRKALVKIVSKPPSDKKKRRWWHRKSRRPDLEMGADSQTSYETPLVVLPQADVQIKAISKIGMFWERLVDKFRSKGTGEVLVDSDLVLWSYFQGGIIETIGCFAGYLVALWVLHVPFDNLYKSALTYWQEGAPPLTLTNGVVADDQMQITINEQAQAAYYVTLAITQWFNLFFCKHRYSYPWGWDIFKNLRTYTGIALSAAISAIIIYVPGINSVIINTTPPPIAVYIAPVATGLLLFVYEVIRKFFRRRGYFGGVPKQNVNLVDLVRTTSTMM